MSLNSYFHLLLAFWRREWLVRYGQWGWGLLILLANPSVMILLKYGSLGPNSTLKNQHEFFFGLMWWLFFSSLLTNTAAMASSHRDLIRKNPFPRSILLLLPLCLSLADWTIGLLLFMFYTLFYYPDLLFQLAHIPFLLLALFPFAIGISALLTSTLFRFPKLRYLVPFLLLLGFVSSRFFQYDGSASFFDLVNPLAGFMRYEHTFFLFHHVGHCSFPIFPYNSLLISIFYFLAGFIFFKQTASKLADF